MTLSVSDAKSILRAKKRLIDLHPWVRKCRDGKEVQIEFKSRISVSSSMPRGLWFRCVLWASYPDVANIQLECDIPDNKSHLPLYRLDWKPLDTHLNGNFGPKNLRGLFFDVGETHEHCCLYNICHNDLIIRANGVQTARRITPDFLSYKDALIYVCARIGIVNLDEVPPPEAQGEMF